MTKQTQETPSTEAKETQSIEEVTTLETSESAEEKTAQASSDAQAVATEATPSPHPDGLTEEEAALDAKAKAIAEARARRPATRRPQIKDEDFGNRKDYQPKEGIGGFYREPMKQGRQEQNNPRRSHRNSNHAPREIEGVLSVRQPSWQQQVSRHEQEYNQKDSGVLTMRQQEHTQQALDWQKAPSSLRDSQNYNRDPDAVWSRFMDDLRRGKIDENGRPKQQHKRHKKQQKHHKTPKPQSEGSKDTE